MNSGSDLQHIGGECLATITGVDQCYRAGHRDSRFDSAHRRYPGKTTRQASY